LTSPYTAAAETPRASAAPTRTRTGRTGTPVDQHQDERHDERGDDDQEAVDVTESLTEVGEYPTRAGHGNELDVVVRNDVPDVSDDRAQLVTEVGVERNDELQRLAVLRRDGRRDVAHETVQFTDLFDIVLSRGDVAGCDPGLALVDDDRRDDLGLGEALL